MRKGVFKIFDDGKSLAFYCKGCKLYHYISIDETSKHHWQFNNDYDKPTFNPSLLVKYPNVGVCHSYIENGKIKYLSDCYHYLSGQTIELEYVE